MTDEDKEKPDALVPVKEHEFAVVNKGPAVWANRFFIHTNQWGVKIVFAEEAERGGTEFRSAVFLSPPDAIALAQALQYLTANGNQCKPEE